MLDYIMNDPLLTFLLLFPAVILFISATIYGLFMKTLFVKAGYKPGDAFIPILNLYRVTQISGLPGWFFFVFLLFSTPGLYTWHFIVCYNLTGAFEIKKELVGPYTVIGTFLFPVGCALIGYTAETYLLDEEQVAKKNTKGFSAKDEEKKK